MASPKEPNSLCLKRKLVADCLSKECKARRVKVENGPSSDASVKRCNCCCTRPNLAGDCVNYLKSEAPSRVVFYKQGSWQNFPEKIMKALIEEFKNGKSSVVTVMDNEPVLVDFLSMTLVNLTTRKQRSVAWFDDTGKCFFPSLFFDEEADEVANVDSGHAEGSAQGKMLDKVANSPPEVVKQVVLESSPPVPHKPSAADILRKKITSVEKESESFSFVRDLFLSGMGPFAAANNILHIHRYSPNDITAQCRLEAFERQMKTTKEERGDANVRYGWLGSKKNDIVRILINGLGNPGKPAEKAGLSAGVYLSPENRAFTSVGLCDVDEKGVQYMLLCRLILGNMETVTPGSRDSFPSSGIYDSGADDLSNPKCYVMWPSHLGTHVRLEYLVSFRLTARVRNYLLGLKGLWFNPSPKEAVVDISTLQPIMGETGEGPTSPWISFRVLFAMIQDSISSVARELLFHHYEEMKESKIAREEMVQKMIIIVGEKILLETLKKLHYCPSLWSKSCVEESSGPTRTAAEDPASSAGEHTSMEKTARNCLLTLGCNHKDSHAPKALAENFTSLGTNGHNTPAMVPKGHDSLAPNSVLEMSASAGAVCQASPSMEPKDRVSHENSAIHCMKKLDPFVARMTPIVRDGLLKTDSGKFVSLAMEVGKRNSVAPSMGPGYASLAPTNASKGSENLDPSLALGNSKCMGAKNVSPAPRLTPEGEEFLSLSIASQSQALHSGKGHGDSTSGATHPANGPGHGNSSRLTSNRCDTLELSIAPKGYDSPASKDELQCPEVATVDKAPESQHCQVPDAAPKGYDAPTAGTVVTNKQMKQRRVPNKSSEAGIEARKKSSNAGVEASGNIARAADALVALSALRKKGR